MFTDARFYGTCPVHGTYSSFTPGCPSCSANPWAWTAPQPVTWPAVVPPLCTGSGTTEADFSLVGASIKGEGRCGICGQRVRLYDGQHTVTHPYRLVTDPEYVGWDDAPASRQEESR